jgi:hypothetical protein
MYGRPVPLGVVLWLVIGLLVAATHHYVDSVATIGGVLSALLAVLLWPLVLLGVHLSITI